MNLVLFDSGIQKILSFLGGGGVGQRKPTS